MRIKVIEISWGCGALILLKKKFGGPAKTGQDRPGPAKIGQDRPGPAIFSAPGFLFGELGLRRLACCLFIWNFDALSYFAQKVLLIECQKDYLKKYLNSTLFFDNFMSRPPSFLSELPEIEKKIYKK